MNNQNNSSAPNSLFARKLADLEKRGYEVIGRILYKDGEYAMFDGSCRWLTKPQYQRLMHEQDGSLFANQPPVDRVQGGLTDQQILHIAADEAITWVTDEGRPDNSTIISFARAILSRQSMMGGEAEMVMSAITEGQKRRASEFREPAGNMTAEFPPHAAVLQDPGEIDERAAFEKFMSKRGWAAVYAGDGQYESPSVQDQWEAWQAHAGIAAPKEQAERAGVPGKFKCMPLRATKEMLHAGMRYFHDKSNPASKANEIYTAMLAAAPSCPITPANASAANGDGMPMQRGQREAFEHWFSDEGKSPNAIERDGESYMLMSAHSAWQAWKAAYAALDVTGRPRPQPPKAPTHQPAPQTSGKEGE